MGAPETDPWAGFTAASTLARNGFRVLPAEPGGKAPLTLANFRHGAQSATIDPERVRDAWIAEPTANIGLAPDGQYVILDVDPRNGGSLERAEELGLPVDGYRELSGGGGFHVPLVMPDGVVATRSAILAPGIDVKGPGAYALSPASRLEDGGRYQPQPGRDVWFWPAIPLDWPFLDQMTTAPRSALYIVQRRDHQVAEALMHDLLAGPQASVVRTCLAAPVGRRSEADYALVALAAGKVVDQPRRPEILAALLMRCSAKTRNHRNPERYVGLTVTNALAAPARGFPTADRFQTIRVRLATGLARHALLPPVSPKCDDATQVPRDHLSAALLGWLVEGEVNDPWAGQGGWVRFPIDDLGAILKVSTRTLQRRLASLEAMGAIERSVIRRKQGGRYRADSWARLSRTRE